MAATYYFRAGGGNTGTAANWSLSSGGPADGAVPTNVDTAIFDAVSGAATVNIALQCAIINFTGYTNTITMTSTISVFGNITLSATMTIAGTGAMSIEALTATLTSNGKTWPNDFTFGTVTNNPYTYTFADNWTIAGDVALGNGSAQTNTLTGNTLNCSKGITSSGTAPIFIGTTKIVMNGTGSIAMGNTRVGVDFQINTAGTMTFTSGSTFLYRTGTLTYIAGTVVTTGSTLDLSSGVSTLNTSGMTWNNVVLANTITLTSNLNVGGNITTAGSTPTINGAFNINAAGSVTPTGTIGGTATLVLTGTGTWSGVGTLALNTTINTAGTITVSGIVIFSTGTLTYSAGTVVTTGSTLRLGQGIATAINTNGITWEVVQINGGTITNNSTLVMTSHFESIGSTAATINGSAITVGGNVTSNGSSTFGGTSVVTMNGTGSVTCLNQNASILFSLTINSPSGTITFSGNVYYGTGTLSYTTGIVFTTSSTFNVTTSSTLATNGIVWNNVGFIGNQTTTFSSNMTLVGSLGLSGSGATITLNGSTMFIGGSVFHTASVATGTTVVTLIGTGTFSSNFGIAQYRFPVTINTAGTITVSSFTYGTGTFTYVAGTVNVSGTLIIVTTCTLNAAPVMWNNFVTGSTTTTITLSGDLNILATYTNSGNATTFTGAFNVNCFGDVTVSGNNVIMTSPATLILCTATTQTWTTQLGTYVTGNLSINCTGTLTCGTCGHIGSTFNYIQGNVVVAPGSTLVNNGGGTWNLKGIVWNNLRTQQSALTFASDFSFQGNLTLDNNQVWNGAFNVYCLGSGGISSSFAVTSSDTTFVFAGANNYYRTGFLSRFPMIIDCDKLTITGTITKDAQSLTYVRGEVDASTATLSLTNAGASLVLTDIDKIHWGGGVTFATALVTMNKFFCGTGSLPCSVRPTGGGNLSLILTSPGEAEFVNVQNVGMNANSQYKLHIATINANKGGNSNVIFMSQQLPQGFVDQDWIDRNWEPGGYYKQWQETPQGFVRNT